ncbi:MAG: Tol-Pal system beta propeller repeat protein TolB, partial [Desulfosalsimonadaceae bacterium]
IWIYLSWAIVLFGLEVTYATQNLHNIRQNIRGSKLSFESRQFVALTVMLYLAGRFYRGEEVLALEEIAAELELPARFLREIMESLRRLGLVSEVSRDPLESGYLEFRLFDPFRQELVFGKRYTGEVSDLRKMVLKFCDEMISRLTGDFGVFNTKIAFASETENGKALYICDFDGENLRRVTDGGHIALSPSWSPDGRSLAYTSYKNGKPDIFVRQVASGNEKLLADHEGLNITPAWVPPDGTRLAATLSFEGDEEIYLLTDSGKVDKRLTRSWGVDVSPAFSPDGEKMAFVSGRAGSPQVYVMNLESGRTSRLTFEGRYNTQPAWSPRGDRIAYSSMNGGGSDIFIVNADGSGIRQLTRDSGKNESPAWSPDGNMIVFSSTRKGDASIYVMTASGSDQRPLVDMPGNQSLPAWSPVGDP